MWLLFYCQTRWTAQAGSRWLLPQPIIFHFQFPLLDVSSALAWTKRSIEKAPHKRRVQPKKKSNICSWSHLTPKVPELKQFIEASLHGHGFWNSNCYLIWLNVLAPLHLRATLKPKPSLYMYHTTAHLLPLLFYLPHLHGIMLLKVQSELNGCFFVFFLKPTFISVGFYKSRKCWTAGKELL